MNDLDLSGLPGGELVARGLEDIGAGRLTTVEALLVWVASQRLRALGLPVPPKPPLARDAEVLLYEALAHQQPDVDVYPGYNALIRRLVSFARALESSQRADSPRPPT